MAIFSLSRRIYEPEAPISASGSNYNPRNTSMYSCGYNFSPFPPGRRPYGPEA